MLTVPHSSSSCRPAGLGSRMSCAWLRLFSRTLSMSEGVPGARPHEFAGQWSVDELTPLRAAILNSQLVRAATVTAGLPLACLWAGSVLPILAADSE